MREFESEVQPPKMAKDQIPHTQLKFNTVTQQMIRPPLESPLFIGSLGAYQEKMSQIPACDQPNNSHGARHQYVYMDIKACAEVI